MKALERFLAFNESGHWSARKHTFVKPEDEPKELHSNKPPRIAVVGDAMIDEYYEVVADRISPEFPIPVMKLLDFGKYEHCKRYPGGAGNVAYQFKHFNFEVGLFAPGNLEGVFLENESNVYLDEDLNYIAAPFAKIPIKQRYWDREKDFPLCRIDDEKDNFDLNDEALVKLQDYVFKAVKEYKPYVTVYSDYDKGMFAGMDCVIDDLNPSLSIVDPKNGPLSKWKGCTIIKPNAKEAAAMSGETDWKKQADYFYNETGCTAVVITQGGRGVVGKIGYDGYFENYPDKEIAADSVIGAGDCFTAFMAMCMSHQMDLLDAIQVAFDACRVYVQKRHNRPVTVQELRVQSDPIGGKVVTAEELVDRDYKLVFTNGCFDLMHLGHLHTLEHANSLGDKLVVAVNSDESVHKAKGEGRPILPINERMGMLAALEFVDFVIEFDEETPYNLIKQIQPDTLVKGSDWADNVVGSDIVDDVQLIPTIEGLSTTNIIEKIKNL